MPLMGRTHALLLASTLLMTLSGCDNMNGPDGGGVDAATADGGDGGVTVCASHGDCDDGQYCNGEETCAPGDPGAGADGCLSGMAPCASESCNDLTDSCECDTNADVDEDGHDSMACGGDDCDDDDPNRYPGNEEVCDDAGHDEDCDMSTVGDRDEDTDGFIDVACCNGDMCGDDCDDDDINVNPGAVESCNGVDDSCSGEIDDGGGLCPGGLCVAGGCQFDAWDRAYGGPTWDSALGVAMDSGGNVYVAGYLREEADFGGGLETTDNEAAYVASYRPDGAFRWVWVGPDASPFQSGARDVAVTPDGSRAFVVGGTAGTDFGSGESDGAFIVVLDGSDGSYIDDARFGDADADLYGADADDSGLVVTGDFAGSVSWGGPSRTADGTAAIVVARYDHDLEYDWDAHFSASGSSSGREATARSIDLRPDGSVVFGGSYIDGGLTIGDALPMAGSTNDVGFIAELDSSGGAEWSHAIPARFGDARVAGVAALDSGGAILVGDAVGTIDPMTGDPSYSADDFNGIMLAVDASGEPDWFRGFGDVGGFDRATAVAEDGMGPVVVGSFSTDTSFGGSTRRPMGTNGFVARYGPTGSHRNDARYGSGGSLFVRDVATGPGGSTVIIGTFDGVADFGGGDTVSDSIDAFVLRLGS